MTWALQYNKEEIIMEEKLNLMEAWDKTFPQSEKVDHRKLTFHNRYGVTLAAEELMIIPGAVHTDLYDNMAVIPFDEITDFFKQYLV